MTLEASPIPAGVKQGFTLNPCVRGQGPYRCPVTFYGKSEPYSEPWSPSGWTLTAELMLTPGGTVWLTLAEGSGITVEGNTINIELTEEQTEAAAQTTSALHVALWAKRSGERIELGSGPLPLRQP